MIVRDIENYLSEVGPMTLLQLSMHFETEAPALEPILDLLLQKKRIHRITRESVARCPGRCKNCTALSLPECTLYECQQHT